MPSTLPAQPRVDVVHPDMVIGATSVERGPDRYEVLSPADQRVVGTAPLARSADLDAVIAAAKTGAARWAATPAERRATLMNAAMDAVEAERERLSILLTREQGKPLDESAAEVTSFVQRMRSFARIAASTGDGHVPVLRSRRAAASSTHELCGSITLGLVSWNFPIGLLAKKIGPVLLAGGAVIVKPSFTTPLTTLYLIRLMNDVGLPPGALTCVTGSGSSIAPALMADRSVSRVHLTGSDATGDDIRRLAAANSHQELILELSGSDPMIVCDDAPIEETARAAVTGRFRNAGQSCIAVKRLYVATEIYDQVLDQLLRLVRLREPGNGICQSVSPKVRMGPLHTGSYLDRVARQLDDAVRGGAEVLVGGRRPDGPSDGHFFEPTVAANVPATSSLVSEEVFGPVLPVFRVRTFDDAIDQANASPWDLNASIWTSRREAVSHARLRIRCRQFWVNRLPFGSLLPIGVAGSLEAV